MLASRPAMSPRSSWPSAAFLDRDGTINEKAPPGEYVESAAEVRMLPGAAAAVARLNAAGVPVLVVTNQRGIALGRMTEDDLAAVHERIAAELARAEARVDGWYHCPHEEGQCGCRKPGTALLERAAAEHGLDQGEALVVGDSESDVEAGRRVGAATILLGRDADSLADAVDRILARR